MRLTAVHAVVSVLDDCVYPDELLLAYSSIDHCKLDGNLVIFSCFFLFDCQIATYIEDFENERKDREHLVAVCDKQRRDLEVLHSEKKCVHQQVRETKYLYVF